ncbi:MAG TPA: protein kinase, partial [Thermoanaerobaculia bacterium]
MDVGDLIGQTLDGKYLIERQLGAGGMGTVFCATHLGTERSVALKIIAPGLMDDNRVLERFKREARAAGRLQHPNVVNVTDFGIAQLEGAGVAYLAMEYLQGFTLGELLQRQ